MRFLVACVVGLLSLVVFSRPALAQFPTAFGMMKHQTVSPPIFVMRVGTSWNTTSTSLTASGVTVQTGDVLVAYGVNENDNWCPSFDIAGGGLTWNLQQNICTGGGAWAQVKIWTAVATSSQTFTVTFSNLSSSYWKGGDVLVFRRSGGIGNSNQNKVLSGTAAVSLTTSQDNSAVVVVNGDWSAVDGTTRTWYGDTTELTYFRNSTRYTVYGGYLANAGPAGTYNFGISSPTPQHFSVMAIEVKGSP